MRRKIGYDARMIEHSGIGVRIQHILEYWPFSETEVELYLFGDAQKLKKYKLPAQAIIIDYNASIYSIREWIGHSKMGEMDYLDIPHFNVPLRYISKCIVTIHDLIPFHFKSAHSSLIKRIYLNSVLRIISYFAHRIIAVSEYTRMDFASHFGANENEITVIYNGIDPGKFQLTDRIVLNSFREAYELPTEYLLTIGIGKKHKNFEFLFQCLNELWLERLLETPLVIGGLGKEIPKELADYKSKYPDKIFFLRHLPYEDLTKVYQLAKIFLFPSLFEGFGFPVVEAQASGTPVLSSNATVLPEILEETAILFDGRNKRDFKEKLLQLLENPALLSRLSESGYKNSQRFHWKEQISHLKALYTSFLFQK